METKEKRKEKVYSSNGRFEGMSWLMAITKIFLLFIEKVWLII
jgi:hypothetical protein